MWAFISNYRQWLKISVTHTVSSFCFALFLCLQMNVNT